MAKLLGLGDTHMQFPAKKLLPAAKYCIHSGDYESGRHEPAEAIQIGMNFLDVYASSVHAEYKIFVAGNHDTWFWNDKEAFKIYAKKKNIIVLDEELVKLGKLRFFGSPYLYTSRRNPEYREGLPEPDSFDVLVTHVPPYGIRDFSCSKKENIGSPKLREFVQENTIKLHLFGHCHEGYGSSGPFKNVALASRSKAKTLINEPMLIDVNYITA